MCDVDEDNLDNEKCNLAYLTISDMRQIASHGNENERKKIHNIILLMLSTMLFIVYKSMGCFILHNLIYYMMLGKELLNGLSKL